MHISTEPDFESGAKQLIAHEDSAAQALCAASAQVGLALRESQEPVAELGALFATLAESLGALRSVPLGEGANDAVAAATAKGLMEQLQSDVYKGIQQLQFYDRLVQHLSHLQDYLLGIANELGPLRTPSSSPQIWDELHSKLRRRLISDEQRGLLDLFLSPQTATRGVPPAERADYSAPGSTELF